MRRIVHKPWGWYITLDEGIDYKVKRITINPHHRFSLQYHRYREEHWSVVKGYGSILVGETKGEGAPGSHWIIPATAVHRATAGDDEFVFIETQMGHCEEDDIYRLEDDYDRESPK